MCLRIYYQKCLLLHGLAFYQWRLMYPHKHEYYSKELILSMIQVMLKRFKEADETEQAVLEATMKDATLKDSFLKRYGMLEEEHVSFNINSFVQIGIKDPFPLDFNPYMTDKKFLRRITVYYSIPTFDLSELETRKGLIKNLVYDQERYKE